MSEDKRITKLRAERLGKTFKLNNGNHASIIDYKGNADVTIKVKETGSIINVHYHNLLNGKAYDPFAPSVYGVGYMGIGKHGIYLFSDNLGKIVNPLYSLWTAMLQRCYSNNDLSYKDVTVCDEWHCFQTFAEDVQHLPGFDEWVRGAIYDFDKDTKQVTAHKEYCKKNCSFIPQRENRNTYSNRFI